jgi:hypothetical protein
MCWRSFSLRSIRLEKISVDFSNQQYEAFFGESERLKSALGLIYADILKLAVGAAIFYRRNGFSEGARASCVYNMRLIVLMGLRKFRDEHLPQF